VIRCPECSAEIERSTKTKSKKARFSVALRSSLNWKSSQIHPVHLNVISQTWDDDEEKKTARGRPGKMRCSQEAKEEDDEEETKSKFYLQERAQSSFACPS